MRHGLIRLVGFFALGTAALVGCRRASGGGATNELSAARTIAVTVDDKGFHPSNLTVSRGERVTLTFTRTSDDTCAHAVTFPDLKIERELPLGSAVSIELPTGQARALGFQCGMGMFKSTIVVQ